MSDNSLIPINNSISNTSRNQLPKTIIPVTYSKIDDKYYGFYSNIDQDISGSMEESAYDYHESGYKSVQFDESVTKSERFFYISAATSGILTASMDALGFTDKLFVKKTSSVNQKEWLQKLIILSAAVCGYKKRDFSGSLKFLYRRAKQHLQNVMMDELSRTPNVTGIVFSIIGQFTGELYSVSSTGKFASRKVPDYYAVGRNDAEKIVYGFLYWVFHTALKYARKKQDDLYDGIPIELKDIIEVLGNLPIMRFISGTDEEVEKRFSEFLTKAFEKTMDRNGENNKELFDLMKDISSDENRLKTQVNSVLLNECITRSFYTVIAFCRLVQREQIISIYDLHKLDLYEVVPANNRIVSRMCLISSGVFAFVNITGALCKALIAKKVSGRLFTPSFIANLNIAGIGRFVFAVAQDWTYLGENIEILFNKAHNVGNQGSSYVELDLEEAAKLLEAMRLDPYQNRLLYSLENVAIEYDSRQTKNAEEAQRKETWHKRWQMAVLQLNGAADNSFFINDREIYKELFELDQSNENKLWFYWMALELAVFELYSKEAGDDKKSRRLKRVYDYVSDQFALKQTIISAKDIATLRKDYDKNTGIVDGSSIRNKVGMTAVAGTAVVAGGAAFAFAPAIAVALAGGAFPGLYGAALTNASLAFFGGGSLAAGGLGMAGGSAVIAGGGALLGLTGSGTVAGLAAAGFIPDELQVSYLAKILTYSRDVFINKLGDRQSVELLRNMLTTVASKNAKSITEMKEERNDLNKEALGKMESFQKYLKNTEKAMNRML